MGRPPHLYAAVYVMLQRGSRVLMSRRANTGFKDGWYTLPAGHVKPGERFVEAAVREAREETGVSILAQDVVVRTLMHRPNKQRGALLTRM